MSGRRSYMQSVRCMQACPFLKCKARSRSTSGVAATVWCCWFGKHTVEPALQQQELEEGDCISSPQSKDFHTINDNNEEKSEENCSGHPLDLLVRPSVGL